MRPFCFQNILLCFASLGALVLFSTPVKTQVQDPISVPFSLEDNRIIVQVRARGNGPFNLLLTSGSALSEVVRSSGGPMGAVVLLGAAEISEMSGTDSAALAFLRDLDLGDLHVKRLIVAMNPSGSAPIITAQGTRLDGAFGFNFLRDRFIQINYRSRKLIFWSTSPFPKTEKTQPGIVSFKTNHSGPIIGNVLVDGKKLRLLLDTGYPGMLGLTPAAAKSLGLKAATPPLIKSLTLGTIIRNDLTPELIEEDSMLDRGIYDGILGGKFLKDYVITLDAKKNKVFFEKFSQQTSP